MFTRLKKYSYSLNLEPNRLVYFATTEDPDEPDTESEEPEESEEDEEKTEKEKIEELENRINGSSFSDKTKELALSILQHQDEDEMKYLEQLLNHTLTQSEFKKLIVNERRGGVIGRPSEEIQSTVRKTVTGKMKGMKPKLKESKEFSGKVNKMNRLNKQEVKIEEDLYAKLSEQVKKGKLSDENAREISQLDPRSEVFEQKLKSLLGELYSDTSLVDEIKTQKENQKNIIERFEKLWEETEKLIEELVMEAEYEIRKERRKKVLSKVIGIDLHEGATIEYIGNDKTGAAKQMKAKITEVDYRITEDLDDDQIEYILSNYPSVDSKVSQRFILPHTLNIGIEYTDNDGNKQTDTFNEGQFAKWVDRVRAVEEIESLDQLEQKLELSEFDQKLEEGLTLEYEEGWDRENSKPRPGTVEITSIDKKDKTISLSRKVRIAGESGSNEDTSVELETEKEELSYGEFAKWYSRTRAEEKMNVSKARHILSKMPKVLQKRNPNVPEEIWKFTDKSIRIEEGEELTIRDEQDFKITGVEENEITLDEDNKMTVSQFVKFVKDNEVESKEKVFDEKQKEKEKKSAKKKLKKIGKLIPFPKFKKLSPEEKQEKKDKKKEKSLNLPTVKGTLKKTAQVTYSMLPTTIAADIYDNTTFLSMKELGKVFSTTFEFISRNWKRNSETRTGLALSRMPGRLGAEGTNLIQAKENEVVNQYKELLETASVWYRRDRLKSTDNQDEAKACFITMAGKGELRFDDSNMWRTMNRLIEKKKMPSKLLIDLDGGKNAAGLAPQEAVIKAMDAIWGEGTGNDWFTQNDSAYSGEVGKYESEANTLDNDYKQTGGAEAELHNMLILHQRGEYVPPAKYEAYLKYIIGAGKAQMHDKIYYLTAGIVTKDPHGYSLMQRARHSVIVNEFMGGNLPLIEFFVRIRPKGSKSVFPEEYAKDLMERFKIQPILNEKDATKRYNFQAVDDFIWKEVLPHGSVVRRTSRAIRNISKMDHDDMPYITPLAAEGTIDSTVLGAERGTYVALTPDGLTNSITGFSNFLKHQGEIYGFSSDVKKQRAEDGYKDPAELVATAIKSFHLFESHVTERRNYAKQMNRLSDVDLKNPPALDPSGKKRTIDYLDETKSFIKKVMREYDFSPEEIQNYWDRSEYDSTKDKQEEHERIMKKFSKEFDRRREQVDKDGKKMMKILSESVTRGEFTGMAVKFVPKEEREAGASA